MTLEKDILQTAKLAIDKSIIENLTNYNGALRKLCEKVISDNQQEMYDLINSSFETMLTSDVFKIALKDALNNKLAKVIVARMGGELEKQVNALKANPLTRAKITLAIEKCLEG